MAFPVLSEVEVSPPATCFHPTASNVVILLRVQIKTNFGRLKRANPMPKIIFVDDEEDLEHLIIQRFARKTATLGYELMFALDGQAALQKIEDHPDIDIALIDINMPKMDGFELLEKLREVRPQLLTVIVSAYDNMSNIRMAMNRGAFDFLTKPIDIPDLEITINKTIAQVTQQKENAKTIHENLVLKQKASELEMQALRAQMNPHFIFNALSSINNFILTNNQLQASEYLIKFSKLIRLILENSTLPLISLDQELEALKLYIELEALRFKHRFEYQIILSKDLDITSIKVPPLILQPFVENAIHHGLMSKEGPGHLSITVTEVEDRLEIKIKDDGIGRHTAGLLQATASHKHKSLGMKVTSERIGFHNQQHAEHSSIEIKDLANEEGKASGTEITIHIPVII